jgi:hypothetical protein
MSFRNRRKRNPKSRRNDRTDATFGMRSTKYLTMAPNNSVFAPVYCAQLRFVETIDLTGNPRKDIVLVGNDIYDPSGADGAKPAYGLPELAAIYTTFVVHRVQTKVTWVATATVVQHQLAIVPSLVSTALASFHEALGHPLSVTGLLGSKDSGHGMKTLSNDVMVRDMFGVPNLSDYGSFAAGTASGNPSSKLYIHVFSENPAAAACACTALIEVRYWVEFLYLKHLDQAA